MPGKNIVKEYRPEAFYHIYNRGVAKQEIFLDEYDYKKFLGYLKLYLTPIELQGSTLKVPISRQLKNYSEKVKLICYCLMPNHFHLLLYQTEIDSINYFMRSLGTKFSMYFNRKYKRVGPVFQGTYKAVEIKSESQLTYITKYIHRNPIEILPSGINLEGYKYSSYPNFLGRFKQSWVKPADILCYFKKSSYRDFVEEVDERDLYLVKD
ncbi:transposase, partial [Patescibacteria group bacterium]|nr:transposase [Patescibacteria group bacterium]